MNPSEYLAQRNASRFEIVKKEGSLTRFLLHLDNGMQGTVESHELFDGIYLAFNRIPQGSVSWEDDEPRSLQLEWCRRGRCEIACTNGKTYFVHEGVCAVHDRHITKRLMRYPMPSYEGITLSMVYNADGNAFSANPLAQELDFEAFRARYAGKEGCRVFTPDETMAALLDSFYAVDERARSERLRCKALETAWLLAATKQPQWRTFAYHPRGQAAALERALDLLGCDLASTMRLEDAARSAGMGLSQFKSRFQRAYGLSPMAYRRQCRLEEGARLLAESNESIAHIAVQVGYRNPSKFAAAFSAGLGMTPSIYRASCYDRSSTMPRIAESSSS